MANKTLGNFAEQHLNMANWLDTTKSTLVVVDDTLNVLYLNTNELKAADDDPHQPGDLLHCSNAAKGEKGCGSTEDCAFCKLRLSVKEALHTNKAINKEVTLTLDDNKTVVLQENATPFEFEGNKYVAILVMNISERKREQMLEHVFFHDMMNLTGALNSFVNILKEQHDPAILDEVKKLTTQIMEEITTHKDLIYAEKGTLNLQASDITVAEFMKYADHSLCPLAQAANRRLAISNDCPDGTTLYTDANLLHRIILNMVKNAVEASAEGSEVTLHALLTGEKVQFAVHNDTMIPKEIQADIFRYGTSSKGEGRGIGTYSMKLFGENYLKGELHFTSTEAEGTTFYFSHPLHPQLG